MERAAKVADGVGAKSSRALRYAAIALCVIAALIVASVLVIVAWFMIASHGLKDAIALTEKSIAPGHDFVVAFPDSSRGISHYIAPDDHDWTAEVIVDHRFLVTLGIPIKIECDALGNPIKITVDGAIDRVVNEVLTVDADGSCTMGRQAIPTPAQWEKILKTKSLDEIFPGASTAPPIPGIDRILQDQDAR